MKVPQAYKDYVEQTIIFARLANDARFYLAPLCLVSLVVAGFTLLVGPCSRRLFGSTFVSVAVSTVRGVNQRF